MRTLSILFALALIFSPIAYAQQTTEPAQQDQLNQEDRLQQERETDVETDVDIEQGVDQDRDEMERDTEEAEEDLPATAGNLPLLLVLGGASLAGAAYTRLRK